MRQTRVQKPGATLGGQAGHYPTPPVKGMRLLWYQAIFIVGIIHSQLPSSKFNMPILCAQSLSLPSSKFKMPILCTQSLRLPSSKFKGPILSTQSLRLPSSKSKRPILCTQSLRLPSSKFERSILCTQSLRLPSSKFKRPKTRNGPPQKKRSGKTRFLKNKGF